MTDWTIRAATAGDAPAIVALVRMLDVEEAKTGAALTVDDLLANGRYDAYLEKLLAAFNPAAVAGVMCRTTLSVDWQGLVYRHVADMAAGDVRVNLRQGLEDARRLSLLSRYPELYRGD